MLKRLALIVVASLIPLTAPLAVWAGDPPRTVEERKDSLANRVSRQVEPRVVIRPSLLNPPPARISPVQNHRANVYKQSLQSSIRRLQAPGRGPLSHSDAIKLNRARGELNRVRSTLKRPR